MDIVVCNIGSPVAVVLFYLNLAITPDMAVHDFGYGPPWDMVDKDADGIGAALLDWDGRLQKYRKGPDQTELPFMYLQYGMEEAAKHPVLADKFVKVPCVRKSVSRIIQ